MGSERSSYRINWNAFQGSRSNEADEDLKPRFFVTEDQQPAPHGPMASYRPRVQEARNIEAYMRYRSMQPATGEERQAAQSHPTFPSRRSAHHAITDGLDHHPPKRPFPPAPRGPQKQARKSLLKELSLAGAISIVFGGIAGLAVYDSTSGSGITKTILTNIGVLPPPSAPAQPPKPLASTAAENGSSIVKKAVSIARLDVSDAEGDASSLIPLILKAEGDPGKGLTLRLTGLPERAYLTAGTRINANAWMLKPGEAENVKLVVPGDRADRFAIAVEALEPQTGDLVAPVRELNVAVHAPAAKPAPVERAASEVTEVLPAAAPPETERNFNLPKPANNTAGVTAMPIPQPLEQTDAGKTGEVASLIESGDKLMDLGDLPAARPFYAKALELGDKKAAWKLGQTYDPAVFAEKKVVGIPPDPKLALQYYLQAQAAGVSEADAAVTGIKALAAQ